MKIRGNTVGTTMRPEKNLVKATDLTPEEKALARANIGAAVDCGLEQPVWGKILGDETETKELLRLSHDGRNGWAKPMSASEYSALMAKATSAMLHGGGVPIMDVPLSDIVHTSYDYDPSEGNVPCIILRDVGAYSDYSDCYLVIEGEEPVVLGYTQIPGEYTGLGDVAAALDHIIAIQENLIGGGGK